VLYQASSPLARRRATRSAASCAGSCERVGFQP
jgi:hypothetical protein